MASPKTPPEEQLLLVGALTQPHGIHGELRAHLFNPDSEVLYEVEELWLKRPGLKQLAVFELLEARPHTKGVLVRLEGIHTRNQAETLRKTEIYVDKGALPALQDDEFYFYQLEGLPVYSTQGEALGHVLRVMPGAAQDLLIIEYEQREVMIPITPSIVPVIDLDEGRIEIEVLPGLLEL